MEVSRCVALHFEGALMGDGGSVAQLCRYFFRAIRKKYGFIDFSCKLMVQFAGFGFGLENILQKFSNREGAVLKVLCLDFELFI